LKISSRNQLKNSPFAVFSFELLIKIQDEKKKNPREIWEATRNLHEISIRREAICVNRRQKRELPCLLSLSSLETFSQDTSAWKLHTKRLI
jgi:hypothetical protein